MSTMFYREGTVKIVEFNAPPDTI